MDEANINTTDQPSTTNQTTNPAPDSERRKLRNFTATIVTFALTALLVFMTVWAMVTGNDNAGIVSGAMVLITGVIQHYIGSKKNDTPKEGQ